MSDARVYGEPIYDEALFDSDVYGEWFAPGATSLVGTSNGTSAVAGSLSVRLALTGSSSGSSTGVGHLALPSTTVAVFDRDVYGEPVYSEAQFESEVYGEWTAVATDVSVSFASTATGTSSATSDIAASVRLVASATGTSSATSALTTGSLAGTATGTSSATSDIAAKIRLVTTATGTSAATSAVARSVGLASTATGTSSSTSDIAARIRLASTATGTSSSTSDITVVSWVVLAAAATGTSSAAAALSRRISLASSATGSSSGTASVTRLIRLVGSAQGSSASTSDVAARIRLVATASGLSIGLGTISGGSFIDSVTVGALDVNDGLHYALSMDSLSTLEQAPPEMFVGVDMAARPPVYVRSQPMAMDVVLNFFLLQPTYSARRDDYEALAAAIRDGENLIQFSWAVGDGIIKTLYLLVETLNPDAFFMRASATAIAPDAIPIAA